jgi:6-pyruvoyltetrahydropterin/6-carboxytetrahydropterin synthase
VFELSIRTHFSAAHHLKGYPGACAAFHGHNWEVEVTVRGPSLNAMGLLIDFRELKAQVAKVIARIDHADLNQVEPFNERNPTSENIAQFLYGELAAVLNGERCRVWSVGVVETPGTRAVYWEPE